MKRLVAFLLLTACSSDPQSGTPAPAGLTCTSTVGAADAAAARAALASASSGSCVVLGAGSFQGPFTVPAGVSLAGTGSTVTGGSAKEPAITLGDGATLSKVDVSASIGIGIAVRSPNARVLSSNVTGAGSAALAVVAANTGTVTITDTNLDRSRLGLWVAGAHVVMTGGRSSQHGGQSLADGNGIVAQGGAKLELDGVAIENNLGTGLLIDGADTTASVKNGTVSGNAERGVWAQRVAGSLTAPALRIEATTISRNKIVGIGGLEARGIIIVGGLVADTIAAPVVTNLATTESIGDGIGLFGGSTDVRLEGNLTIQGCARAAGLVDGSERGIIIVGGNVSAGASGLKFVIQNTKDGVVQVATTDVTASAPLGISAPQLSVPPVLQ